MTAYATTFELEQILGVSFTDDQYIAAEAALDAATALIDQAVGRSWLTAGTVTGEFNRATGDRLYLKHYPVTSITSLVRTSPDVTTANQTLVAARDYKLWDAARGLVSISVNWWSCAILATYVHTESVPADIVNLTAQLAAGMMRLILTSELAAGVKRYTLWGGDLSVEFGDSAINPVVMPMFTATIGYRRVPAIA